MSISVTLCSFHYQSLHVDITSHIRAILPLCAILMLIQFRQEEDTVKVPHSVRRTEPLNDKMMNQILKYIKQIKPECIKRV